MKVISKLNGVSGINKQKKWQHAPEQFGQTQDDR